MSGTIEGYIFIADISGYTMFLTESELEHAQAILQALLEIMIENTRLPLVISRLEGDAIISYAKQNSILQGQTIIDMVESSYVAFKRAIELMVINTSCTCNACQNMRKLDLKCVIHFGSFGLQPLPAYTELVGTDVNLIHRLTKNHVHERTGLDAYLLMTQALVDALGLQAAAQGMISLTESYEHIGEVGVFVQDMAPVWEREHDRNRMNVAPEDALMAIELEFPVTPVHMWDYATKPEYFIIMFGADRASTENAQPGRVGDGSVYTCAHGSKQSLMTVVDWQPFETLTFQSEIFAGMSMWQTYRIEPANQGSHLTILVGHAFGGIPILRFMADAVIKGIGRIKRNWALILRQRMEQDLAEGIRPSLDAVEIDLEAIRKSIQVELAKEK